MFFDAIKQLSDDLDRHIHERLILDDLIKVRMELETLRFYNVCRLWQCKKRLNEVKEEIRVLNGRYAR